MKTTGRLISKLRKDAGYTQQELANALHVTDKAVSKWERDICLPDTSILPKLALLLDIDMDTLINHSFSQDNWVGYIDLSESTADLTQNICDKPSFDYMLSHFLLLGITHIYIKANQPEIDFLSDRRYSILGFTFTFNPTELPQNGIMAMLHPFFLFGSDLTHQFWGAMLSRHPVVLVPLNQKSTFFFIPSRDTALSISELSSFLNRAISRKLGRGMIYIAIDNSNKLKEISYIVECYQKNSTLLIACLEEIAITKHIISKEELFKIYPSLPCKDYLLKV